MIITLFLPLNLFKTIEQALKKNNLYRFFSPATVAITRRGY